MNVHLVKHGQGMPLVFFHGWGFDHSIWLPLVTALQDSYQLILVDLPGFGLTPAMDWDEFKNRLLQQVTEPFSLVGWSMGGLYATRMAIEEPDRVRHLMNISSSPRFISDDQWPGVAPQVFVNFYNNLTEDTSRTLRDFLSLQMNKSKVDWKPNTLPSAQALAAGLAVLDEWDLRSKLSQITIPACYLFGRLDPITPVKTMVAMEEAFPNFKYILFQRSAHMPFLSEQQPFISELLGFIE